MLPGLFAAVKGFISRSEPDLDAKHTARVLRACEATLLELLSPVNSRPY